MRGRDPAAAAGLGPRSSGCERRRLKRGSGRAEEEDGSEGLGTVVQAPMLRRHRHRWDGIWKEESVLSLVCVMPGKE